MLATGIEDSAIEIVPNEVPAVARSLDLAKEGDLIVLFVDDVRRSWNQVIHYEGDGVTSSTPDELKPVTSFVEEDPQAFSLDAGARLVRDERGVRLARDEEESD